MGKEKAEGKQEDNLEVMILALDHGSSHEKIGSEEPLTIDERVKCTNKDVEFPKEHGQDGFYYAIKTVAMELDMEAEAGKKLYKKFGAYKVEINNKTRYFLFGNLAIKALPHLTGTSRTSIYEDVIIEGKGTYKNFMKGGVPTDKDMFNAFYQFLYDSTPKDKKVIEIHATPSLLLADLLKHRDAEVEHERTEIFRKCAGENKQIILQEAVADTMVVAAHVNDGDPSIDANYGSINSSLNSYAGGDPSDIHKNVDSEPIKDTDGKDVGAKMVIHNMMDKAMELSTAGINGTLRNGKESTRVRYEPNERDVEKHLIKMTQGEKGFEELKESYIISKSGKEFKLAPEYWDVLNKVAIDTLVQPTYESFIRLAARIQENETIASEQDTLRNMYGNVFLTGPITKLRGFKEELNEIFEGQYPVKFREVENPQFIVAQAAYKYGMDNKDILIKEAKL